MMSNDKSVTTSSKAMTVSLDLEAVSRRIAAQFQLEGDWPWEYVMTEIKDWLGHPDTASLAQERDDLLRKVELTDRMIRAWRRAYFRDNPPSTYLANVFNDALRTLGTFEIDHEKNAEREANA